MSFKIGSSFAGNAGYEVASVGRAADINNVLQVKGGQIVSLSNAIVEGKDISYSIIEIKSDGTINSKGAVGAAWYTQDITLQKDTAYILIFFKNGDGSTDFTVSGASELPNCITLK